MTFTYLVHIIYYSLCQDAVEIQYPATGQSTRYETFSPNRPSPYSRAACEKLQMLWISGNDSEDDVEDSSDGGALLAEQVTSIDNDDEWEDTVEHLSSGVGDILVTGKVCEVLDCPIYRRCLLVFSACRRAKSRAMHGATSLSLAG
jgi:hypothetical protein